MVVSVGRRPESVPIPGPPPGALPSAPRRKGRIPPQEWYPAGVPGVESSFLTLPDGERVRVLTSGSSTAPPVVLVHGWACSAYSWRRQLPALAEGGFRALAVDLRGHGLSDRPAAAEAYTAEAMTTFLDSVLTALHPGRVALVGHSLGAGVATRLALRRPERVARLVVIGGVGFGRIPMIPLLRGVPDALARPFLPISASRALFRLVLKMVGGPDQYSSRDLDEYWAATQFPEFTLSLWQLIRHFDWTELTEEERGRLIIPHLLLFGGRDRLVRSPVSSVAPGSSADGGDVVLAGVGHAIQEEAPEQVNRLLLSFLEPWMNEAAGTG